MPQNVRSVLFAIALSAFIAPAIQAEAPFVKPPVPETSAPLPAINVPFLKIDPVTLAAVTPEKFPDADTVNVDNSVVTRYAADGTSATRDDNVIKILTEKGRRKARTQSFDYNIFYETAKIVLVRIIKPDGTTTDIDVAANSKEMTDRSSMEANIYDPNDKVITLAIPGLQVGDTVQIVVDKYTKRARMANTYCDWQSFESADPILHMRYELRGPKSHPIRTHALLGKIGDTVTHTETVSGDDVVHTWEARDIAQFFPEPGMPAAYTCTQRLLVSTLGSWEEISKWYWSISEPHLKSTPEIKAKVQELVAGIDDRQKKIRRIFKFVSQEIRYMGITVETEAPGYEPHDVKLTFDNRYGVCRDKAALLVTMLRDAGLDAFPVLIMVGPPRDIEVPTPYFNHAITAVRNADGTYQLMDSTDEHTADLCPPYLCNKSFLVANPAGETLKLSPMQPAKDNMLEAETNLQVLSGGDVHGSVKMDFAGINDTAFRGSFVRAKPEDIRRFFETVVKSVVPGATLETLEVTPKNMMDTGEKIRASLTFKAPNFFTENNDKTVLQTPQIGARLAIASRILGESCGLEKRRFPIEIPFACAVEEKLSINLPENIGDTLALPESKTIETPALRYSQKSSREKTAGGDTLTGVFALQISTPLVKPDEYAQLKAALKDIEYAGRQSPVFAVAGKTDLQADVRILENKSEITLIDAGTLKSRQTVRKEILTYAGKKSSGELQFNYNPVWETVKLVSAKVTLKDGTSRTVQPAEINEMDADWVASAPRYPAGKTLVISLPGVEEGAIVEYVIDREAKDQPFLSIEKTFFGFEPVEKDSFTLTAPENLNLYIQDELGATVSKKDNTVTYTAENSRKLSKREGSLPPAEHLGNIFQAATLNDPGDLAGRIIGAVRAFTEPTAPVKTKAAELIAECRTNAQRIIAIRDFVAKNIRLAGPNFTDLPLRCLTPAEKTLADGYGNEADRSILIAALLEAAGIDRELVLAASGPSAEYFWQPGQPLREDIFNRFIVRAIVDQKLYYLDALSIYSQLGITGLEGAPAVVLSEDAELETITPEADYASADTTSFDVNIDAGGDAEITFTRQFPGADYEGFKRAYTEMTPEQRSRRHQNFLAWLSQAAVPTGDFVTDFAYPGKLTFSAKIPRYAVRSGKYIYFDIPGAAASATPATADTRENPLFLQAHTQSYTNWHFTLPAGTTVQMMPENISWDGPGVYGKVEITGENRRDDKGRPVITLRQSLELNPAIIPPASYPSLLEINRRLSNPAQWRILAETTETGNADL